MWLPASFRLQIDGLDATKVSRIEGLTIVSKAAENPAGEPRDLQKEAATLEISNLVMTLAESGIAGWKAWFEDFVVKGNNADANEKNGSLEYLTNDKQGVQLAILGISESPAAPRGAPADPPEKK